jgi:hypothetical protein
MTTALCTVLDEVRTERFFSDLLKTINGMLEAGTSPFEHQEDLVETPSLTTSWPPPRHRHALMFQNEPTPPPGARSASAWHVWHALVLYSDASEAQLNSTKPLSGRIIVNRSFNALPTVELWNRVEYVEAAPQSFAINFISTAMATACCFPK